MLEAAVLRGAHAEVEMSVTLPFQFLDGHDLDDATRLAVTSRLAGTCEVAKAV